MSWRRFGFFVTVCGALGACATSPPVNLNCSLLKLPVATGEEVALPDFSVTSPRGANWCQGPRTKGMVVFYTHPLLGRMVTAQSLTASASRDTAYLMATEIQLRERSVTDQGELSDFAGAFLRGQLSWAQTEDGVVVGAPPPKITRITWKRVEVLLDPAHPDTCVRFEVDLEERNNPLAPGIVFDQRDFGALCRLSNRTDRLAYLFLSERSVQGQTVDPAFFDTLKVQDGEPFLRSFRSGG
jgi:hypothetical protein